MESVLEPGTRNRRKWLVRAVLLGFVLVIATSGGVWWLLRDRQPPLTAEEQPFVGYWEPPAPIRSGTVPYETVGYEFRTDRKVIYHRRDPKTGARSTEDTGVRWRAADDRFFYSTRARRMLGLVSEPVVIEMRVTWDGPDHCRMALVHHGPGGASTDDLTRRPAPEGR
jgi:hypothetical protein